MWTLFYYKRIESCWLKGQIRNLTFAQTVSYAALLRDLFGEKTMLRLAREKK